MKDKIGEMAWIDLTVANAVEVKDFYQSVVGWKVDPVSMGEYEDFSMNSPADNQPVAGVCHAQGVNADLPPAWLPYFLVEDIEVSVANVKSNGGSLITEIKSMGSDRYAVVKDPAGAVCAIYQKNS